jgi:hypothetical protein
MSDPDQTPEQRIEAALARLGADHEPPLGWEARVLAATGMPRRPWWHYAVPGVGLVAAAALGMLVLWPAAAPALALRVDVEHRAVVRGQEAQLGDVVHVAATGGGGQRAIWIYRDEVQLVLRCPGDAGCAVSRDAIAADLTLRRIGTYQILALTADAALPVSSGSYGDDVVAARRAGAATREQTLAVD